MRFLFALPSAAALLLVVSPQNATAASATPNFDLSWEAQASGACKSGEFEMFLEAFMRSRHVQKQHTARVVKVGRFGKTKRIARQNHGPVPVEMSDYHFIIRQDDHAAFAPVSLKVDLRPFGKGGYRLDWIRANYDDSGEGDSLGDVISTEGPPGYLIFKKNYHCWELTDDVVVMAN